MDPLAKSQNIAGKDFILSGGLETAKSVEGITTLTLIAMNLDEYNQHIVLDFKKLQELSISDVEFLIKLFVRSDIKKPLRQLIQSIEFVPSELTKNL